MEISNEHGSKLFQLLLEVEYKQSKEKKDERENEKKETIEMLAREGFSQDN